MDSHCTSRLGATSCEVRLDALTRQLYATDASIYRIEPVGVAFPRSAAEAAELIRAAVDAGMAIIPRGAGTGLVGGAIGEGLVVDFSRYNRQISEFDVDRRSVRVGAGVVLDQLNAFAKPHGLWFGPDVATSSRATLGGMIANDSSGARTPRYGTTGQHVISLEVVLADGAIANLSHGSAALQAQLDSAQEIVHRHRKIIESRMPAGLVKRWPGYALDRFLKDDRNLCTLLSGSEGTLAAIMSAEIRLEPLPRQRGLGVIFFADVADAMQAVVELLDLHPVAIEHVDRTLFDQTRGQLAFQSARALLRLDEQPCESFLIVEFFDDAVDRLAELSRRKLGLRRLICADAAEQAQVWALRKAGLSLLTGCAGSAKPVTGIEDTAVRPEQLPAYVSGLQSILLPLGITASYYGHAAGGLLHVRPVLDLHNHGDRARFRQVAAEVSSLIRQFKGSIAGEHGVGMARTEFLAEHLGPELMAVTNEIKRLFDPGGIMNPGKIVHDGRFRLDAFLRADGEGGIRLPFSPRLGFVEKDHSFIGNLEQCNGCGGCRKDAPTMCPTFVATSEELMSTRGRANVIRAVLEQRLGGPDALNCEELDAALSNCLSCKACKSECPSNVDLSLLKAELLNARHQRKGVSLLDRMICASDGIGRWGCRFPSLFNRLAANGLVRHLMEVFLGVARTRPVPPWAGERFDHWFARRSSAGSGTRGRVMLWDDTWVRYHEPHIGRAAVAVLEAAGYEVVLPPGRACCGRPAFSRGVLDEAARLGRHNLNLLNGHPGVPIIFLEPSCHSMFVDDYLQLGLKGAERIARQCLLFEQFVGQLLEAEPHALQLAEAAGKWVAIHGHCHTKALAGSDGMKELASRVPGVEVSMLESGCCGMAGAFGMLNSKQELSLRVAEPLVKLIRSQPAGTAVVASGTSCRQQIGHLAGVQALHIAEFLARHLRSRGV